MGTGKPHRRRDSGGSSSWSMGVDVVQFPKTVDEVTGGEGGLCHGSYLVGPSV